MWSIVLFEKENTVAAVPQHWYRNGRCAWPKVSAKNRSRMVELRTKPNSFDFDYYTAKQILTDKPIATLKEAQEKAAKAQTTSDLSSTEELTPFIRSLKNKKNQLPVLQNKKLKLALPEYHSSDDESDDSIKDKTYVPFENIDNQVACSSNGIHDSNNERNSSTSPISNKEDTDNRKLLVSTENPDITVPKDTFEKPYSNKSLFDGILPGPIELENNFTQLNCNQPITAIQKPVNINHNDEGSTPNKAPDDTAFQDFVKSTLINIKYEVRTISYAIDVIKAAVLNIETRPSLNTELENQTDDDDLPWPITDYCQLEIIENKLKDPKVKKNETIRLSRLIGLNVSESVRRMMTRMFDDTFIKQFSFIGFKGKNKFNGLNCCQLLFNAIRKDMKFQSTSDKEIASVTARWMAQASNRLNKKKNIETINNIAL